jgi:hypothetical protein
MTTRPWPESATQIAVEIDVLANELREVFNEFKPELVRMSSDGHMPIGAHFMREKIGTLLVQTQRLRERVAMPAPVAAMAIALSRSPPVVTDTGPPMAKVIPLFKRPEPGPFAGETL